MSELWNRVMIVGIKCDGCKMWTRITNGNRQLVRYIMGDSEPYYCDECIDNVTHHTTKATIVDVSDRRL